MRWSEGKTSPIEFKIVNKVLRLTVSKTLQTFSIINFNLTIALLILSVILSNTVVEPYPA